MTFPRVVSDAEYENPPEPFIPPEVQELKATLDEGIAAYERARVARDLGIGVVPDE